MCETVDVITHKWRRIVFQNIRKNSSGKQLREYHYLSDWTRKRYISMDYRNELCILINESLERAREYRKLKWKRD